MRVGGRSPVVIDFVDVDVPLFKGMHFKRRKIYAALGARLTRYDHMRNEVKTNGGGRRA